MSDRGSEGQSRAERAGVVDQQGAAGEKMDDDDSAPVGGGSAAERAGAVDQQGALADDLADE